MHPVHIDFTFWDSLYRLVIKLALSQTEEFATILLPSQRYVVAHLVVGENGWTAKTVEPVNAEAVYLRQDVVHVATLV